MAISGLRDTNDFTSNQRPKSFAEGLLLLDPNGQAPLTALTSLMSSRSVDDPIYNWFEKVLDKRCVQLTAAITTGTANLTVAAGTGGASGAFGLKAGDLLRSSATEEIFRVANDPVSDTSVTVTRGFEGTTPTALDPLAAGKDPFLYMIGSAYEQGSLAPTGVSFDGALRTNYCQIFRATTEITGTAAQTFTRDTPKGAFSEQRRELIKDMALSVEKGLWFNKKSAQTVGGKPLYTMDGLLAQIPSSCVQTADTTTGFSMTNLEDAMLNIFKFGSQQKIAFCGNTAALTLNRIYRLNSQWEMYSGEKEFGMTVNRLVCPFGELTFKTHPLFNYMPSGVTAGTKYYGMDSHMVVLDASKLKYVYLRNRDITSQKDLQLPGADGMKEGLLGEISIQVSQAQTMYWLKNVAKAAVG